jgi:hypothetical protein
MKNLKFLLGILIASTFSFAIGSFLGTKQTIFVHKLGCPSGKCVVNDDICSIVNNLEAINHIIEEQGDEALRYSIKHRTDNIGLIINNSK